MADGLQILDAKDHRAGTDTVLFDCNDPTGVTNATLEALGYATIRTRFAAGTPFSLNAPAFEFLRFSGSGPGGVTVGAEAGFAASSWGQRIQAPSYDALATAVGYLGRLLLQGGVMKWTPQGGAVRYIDFEPSPMPALLDGRPHALNQATNFFETADGVLISIVRQPYLRGPELNPAVNVLVNPTLLHDQDATTGTPDSWAWDSTSNITVQNIDAADEAYEFTIATGAARNLRQSTGAASAANGETWTLSFYARSTAAGAKAAPVIEYLDVGSVVQTTSAVTLTALTTTWQRLSVTFTAADADTNRIRANLRMDNDDATSYVVQFRNVQLEKASAVSLFRVGTQTIYADPASTSGPGRTMAVWVQGDVPVQAELYVLGTGTSLRRVTSAVLTNPYKPGSGAIATWLNTGKYLQCESLTAGTDTASQANANASGGNVMRTTYVTATMSTRVSTTSFSAAAFADRDWAVFVRVANISAQPTTHSLRLVWGPGSTYTEVAVPYTSESTSEFDDVLLGIINVPLGSGAFPFSLQSARVSGTGNLEWDCVLLVPADGLVNLNGDPSSSSDAFRTIPPDEAFVEQPSDASHRQPLEVEGPLPLYLQPGLNGLYVAAYRDPPSGTETHYGHALSDANDVKITYSPRYLT